MDYMTDENSLDHLIHLIADNSDQDSLICLQETIVDNINAEDIELSKNFLAIIDIFGTLKHGKRWKSLTEISINFKKM